MFDLSDASPEAKACRAATRLVVIAHPRALPKLVTDISALHIGMQMAKTVTSPVKPPRSRVHSDESVNTRAPAPARRTHATATPAGAIPARRPAAPVPPSAADAANAAAAGSPADYEHVSMQALMQGAVISANGRRFQLTPVQAEDGPSTSSAQHSPKQQRPGGAQAAPRGHQHEFKQAR